MQIKDFIEVCLKDLPDPKPRFLTGESMLIQVQEPEAYLVRSLRDIYGRAERFVTVLRSSGITLADLDMPKLFEPPGPEKSKELNQWLSSRACVASSLVQGLPKLLGTGFNGRLATSLSHTDGMAVAAVAALDEGGTNLGIGIDVEKETRPVAERIVTRISLLDTPGLPIEPLTRWTIKEAAFKAHNVKGSVMKDYALLRVRQQPDVLIAEGVFGDVAFRTYTTTLTGHKVTLGVAWQSDQPSAVSDLPSKEEGSPIADS
ncbi:MAG: hypothetical protein KF784_05150 [Fimbriimonadaceae bacterium]|nr:hypothetical protein [Fimbriimonadaceae bacterium]